MTKKVTRVDNTVDLHKQAVDALQAKNEEYEALNEELRSTIEKLQAATEELQAQNEELQQQAVALRESEEKYRLLFNSGGDAIFIHDEEARILAVNQQACEQFGYTHAELLSMKVNQMDSPADGQHAPARIARVIEQGSLLFEIVHQRKDGSLIPHEVNTRRIIWDGQPAMMSICRDITARKQMEEALLNSEAQKNAILNGITTNIALVDKELKILWANKAAVSSVNKQSGDIVGHPCYSFWGDKISPCPNCPTLKAFKTGKSEHIIVETPDGRIWDERGEPILDAAGNVTAVVEIAQDITDRKQAEEALRESEERFRILSEAAFEAIAIHEEGVLINANDQYFKMFGYEPGEAIGKQMMSKTIAPEARESVTNLIATDSLGPYESIGVRKDGTRFPIEVRARKMDYKGRKVRFGAIVDITERKRAEEALMAAEETYRNIFLNSQTGIFRTDLQTGLILDANDTVARFIGYQDRASLLAEPFSMVVRYVDAHARAEMLSLVQAHGEINNYEARFRRNDGAIIWIRFSAKIVREKGWMEGVSEDITDRKQAEEALRESEQRFNLAIEGTGAGLWDWDMVKDQVVYSAQWKRMLGYEVHEVEDTFSGWKNLWHPDDCVNIEKALDDHLAGKTDHYEIIHRLRHKDGGWRWILTRGDIVKDAQGKPCRWVGTNLDITAQKQAEEALRESEEWHRTILQTTMDGFWRADMQGHLLEVNETYCRMSGYSKEELLTMSFSDLEAIEPDAETAAHMQKVITRGEDRFETWHHRKDGSIFEVEVSVQYRPSQKGQLVAFLRDITNRKQAEEALRRSETNYRSVIENIQDVFYRSDDQGNLIMASPSYVALLGYESLNDCLGKSIAEVGYYDPEKRTELLRELQGKGSVTNYEVVLKRRDGTPVTVETNSHFYLDDSGNIAGVEGTFRDITERKQAEDEKRRLEERLQHADKMDAIGTLAGGIAHDFNNLLMGIQGYASLSLMNLDPSHPNYERLKRIEDQVQSGADLTRQLLGFARGGRYDVKPADMNDILEKSSSMFGRTKKEISIHRKYGKDLWTVEVDQGQMDQVFMNLYVNAWQAMPGGGEIYLETENIILDDEQAFPYAVNPGRYIKISMTDTGTGMDEKTRERIFDPFFTTKEMGRGTGLGLATVYGIIKGHKGMINVYSEPGHGTTFTIYLPASEKEVVKEKTTTATIARGTETILIVDDEKMVLEVSRAMLESVGYRVFAAGSGQEAIAVYLEKQKEIDLVILDMIMPGISGGETFDRLREINPGIKVLLSSGYSINGQAQEILDRGCNGFLQKPFQLSKFSSKVRETID